MVIKGVYFKSHGINGGFFYEKNESYERQDIMVLNVPNAFIQTKITPKTDGEERVIMKITGVLVEMLVKMDSETYKKNMVFENRKKVIYVVVLRAIY